MPNTLAHLGVQGLTTRVLIRESDLKWIYIGCVIPDFPWIMRRIIISLYPAFDASEFSVIIAIQSSLFFCLLLSSFLSFYSSRFWRTFAILSLNSFLHLLLDALQIKWGNGPQFLAPFDWRLTNFDLFWPDSLPTYVITSFGLLYFVWAWRKSSHLGDDLTFRSFRRITGSFAILFIYLAMPFFFIDSYIESDSRYVREKISKYKEYRAGRYVEIDRISFIKNSEGDLLRSSYEDIKVKGMAPDSSSTISAKGVFESDDCIRIDEYHVHNRWFRSSASYVGLVLVLLLWLYSLNRGILSKKVLEK